MNDLEFAEFMAEALGMSEEEYLALLADIEDVEYEDIEEYDVDDERGDAYEPESEYELDEFWPDDDWLDPYEEWEISPDYGED